MKTTMVFIFILCQISVFGQLKNLLRNPSLDTVTPSSCGTNSAAAVINWDQNPFNDPIAFNACLLDTFYSIPKNQEGFQYAKNGTGYSGIGVIGNVFGSNFRVYLQSKLSRKLKNKNYYIYIYISLTDESVVATSRIQIALTTNQITNPNCCQFPIPLPFGFTPQVQNPLGNFMSDTATWVKIHGAFKANGNEEYITIGNFFNDVNTDTVHVNPLPYPNAAGCAYYVDDMHLVEEDRAVAYFDTTLENNLCVQLGNTVVLGDTLVRPWLTYEWRDAAGNIVGNQRNLNFTGTTLGTTFYTLTVSDTTEDAFITKAIDTVYIDVKLNCPSSIMQIQKHAELIQFKLQSDHISIYNLPQGMKQAEVVLRSIEGKSMFKIPITVEQNNYSMDKVLAKGFYIAEVLEQKQSIKRQKVIVD